MKTLIKIIPVFMIGCLITLASSAEEDIISGRSINNTNGYLNVKMIEDGTINDRTVASSIYTLLNPLLTAINIDITSVEIHYTSQEKEHTADWVILNTDVGVYDLLMLQNNIMVIVAHDTALPAGNITQIKFVLGDNNSVLISGDNQHMLTIPRREIIINVDPFIKTDKNLLLIIGFDARKSIVEDDMGIFTLKPVVEIKSVNNY